MEMRCPKCDSDSLGKAGKADSSRNQRWKCYGCGYRTTNPCGVTKEPKFKTELPESERYVVTSAQNATGIHTAIASATIMTDANAHLIVNELVGLTIENVTDGSSGVITANTETTITVAALAGGTLNQWSTNDVFSVDGAGYDTEDWDVWDAAFTADTVLRQTKIYDDDVMYAKVLIENLDAGQAVTDVEVIATVGV